MASSSGDRPDIPAVKAFFDPIMHALRAGGGRASVRTMLEAATRDLHLTEEQLRRPHDFRRGKRSEVSYRMAWARTALRTRGLIRRLSPGEWALVGSAEE